MMMMTCENFAFAYKQTLIHLIVLMLFELAIIYQHSGGRVQNQHIMVKILTTLSIL